MPLTHRTPEHELKLIESRRKAAFDTIADPLWRAIADGNGRETARLQGELARLLERHTKQD